MGGVRTGVGGGSRGKIGLGADVAGNCCRGPDLSFCGSPFPMGGEGEGLCAKGAWDTEHMWLGRWRKMGMQRQNVLPLPYCDRALASWFS